MYDEDGARPSEDGLAFGPAAKTSVVGKCFVVSNLESPPLLMDLTLSDASRTTHASPKICASVVSSDARHAPPTAR